VGINLIYIDATRDRGIYGKKIEKPHKEIGKDTNVRFNVLGLLPNPSYL
jgi:hypothetical protein